MIVSVTTLGSTSSGTSRAANQVVNYLEGTDAEGSIEQRRSQPGSLADNAHEPSNVGGYYADSAERPGTWRGDGATHLGLTGTVNPEPFLRLLQGQHPHTGQQLVGPQGSNGRTTHQPPPRASRHDKPTDLLSAIDVANLANVDVSYIRRIANKTDRLRLDQLSATTKGELPPETPTTFLDASKDHNGSWLIRRDEAQRFAATRSETKVVLGYDVTWSAPKSVSALYAQGNDADRQAIMDAMESAVAAGMDYLQADGFHVRRGRSRETGSNMIAASYRHFTNRALEPQLHEHVVIANMATNSDGHVQTVDARGLFAHATTAGYLAAAELRTQLTQRLGVEWGPIRNGITDIDGVNRNVIMAISSRRQAVLTLAEEMGYTSPAARQTAALATRPAKDRPVDATQLQQQWRNILTDAGFDQAAVNKIRNRQQPDPWTPRDIDKLFTHLTSDEGVTGRSAVFDRRHVLQAVAEFADNRLTATNIITVADQWLRTEAVIPLTPQHHNQRETIGRGAAQVALTPDEQRYTTPEMFALEQRVRTQHLHRLHTNSGAVDATTIEKAITASNVNLGADQAAMVRTICESGDQFQAVVGRAGAGKTTALRVAADAWKAAGFTVLGAAPFAEAARNLETETGLKSTTLEGLLTRLDHANNINTILNAKTVIIVDEASTIGNRQLGRLYEHARDTGATVRTIGDPHQHQSVEAGGLWKHLTTAYADHTPSLNFNRRQTGADMAEVRVALDEYRSGHIKAAIERLDNDNRITTAPTWNELLDTMAADWFVDHQHHIHNNAAVSKMIAERNSDRHDLNHRAQALLRSNGELGEPVRIGEANFHVGDRIVAQATNRDLHPDANQRRHVINGSQGTVTNITGTPAAPNVAVDFDGLGSIMVPHEFIVNEVGPGRGGGLTPGYAVTSFKAEGQTYDTGRNLATPGSINTEGMYVALTRGRNDQRTYALAPSNSDGQRPELPIITDERTAVEALTQSLNKNRSSDLASVVDPEAADRATTLAKLNALPLRELVEQRRTAQAALDRENQRVENLQFAVDRTDRSLGEALLKHGACQRESAFLGRRTKGRWRENQNDRVRPGLTKQLATIDQSIGHRVANALDGPTKPYLTEALGKRPTDRSKQRSWDKAATSIETYRHLHLGVTPHAGAFNDRGVNQAIGKPPSGRGIQLRFWKQVQRHIQQHVSPEPERSHAMVRTR